jgi:hypothetical protein
MAKDPRFERLPCLHKGTYADDCLVERVSQVPSRMGLGDGGRGAGFFLSSKHPGSRLLGCYNSTSATLWPPAIAT